MAPDLLSLEHRLEQSERRLQAAEKRFRVMCGLAVASVIGAFLLSGRPTAIAQGGGPTLDQRVSALENKTQFMSVNGTDTYFTATNVHFLNGTGSTEVLNGLGNVTIGYNELRATDTTLEGATDTRTGSHNLIIGSQNNYSSYGSIVAGLRNASAKGYSSVLGGTANTSSGGYSVVVGGYQNTASGNASVVVGGQSNTAQGGQATVGGGMRNAANSQISAISGGFSNVASGYAAVVSSGQNNIASGDYSTAIGRHGITASTQYGFMPLDPLETTVNSHTTTLATHTSQISTLNTEVATMQTGLTAVQGKTQFMTTGTDVNGKAATLFTACNVYVLSGSGSTAGTVNGLGNLIIGYNELRNANNARTGSHNLIVGSQNNYSSYGGVVFGLTNASTNTYATVTAGTNNSAQGTFSAVSGGQSNTAAGNFSGVSGGRQNSALGDNSAVHGGNFNSANGNTSAIGGGTFNNANGLLSSIMGGFQNTAGGQYSVVGGGQTNAANGDYSSVTGGQNNTAWSTYSAITGGQLNTIGNNSPSGAGVAAFSVISGGQSLNSLMTNQWIGGTFHSP